MADGRDRFIRIIECAAERAHIMPASEASTLFRRAALRLRNPEGIVVDPAVDSVLSEIAVELREPKPDLIRRILREWLEQNSVHFRGDLTS